jgi:hypothetical protein
MYTTFVPHSTWSWVCVNIYLILLSYQQSCYLQTCQELDKILVWGGVMCLKWVLSIQSVWTRYPQTAYDVRNHIYWCPMYSTHKMTIFGQFWSILAMMSKMMARVQLLCAEYVVKYRHSSTKLWHSCTRLVSRGSQKGIICQDWVIFGGAMVM